MQKIYTYGFWILLAATLLFAGIIVNKDAEMKYLQKSKEFSDNKCLGLQNTIDNLQEDFDTLQKKAKQIVYVTKIKERKRDSVYVNITDTNYVNTDTCNNVVQRLFSVCRLDKEIFRLKDSTIANRDSAIYKKVVQVGKYSEMLDEKNEVNEHLQQEIKIEITRKKGAMFLFSAMAILNAYLIIKK